MPKLRRPIFDKRSLIEAAGFLLAAVVGIIASAAYSSTPFGNTEVLLLLMALSFSAFYYYIRLPRLPAPTRKEIVRDLLLAAGVALGPQYRLNIMRPVDHDDDAQRQFGFLCHFRMQNVHRYKDKIRLATPGVGTAYIEKRLVYLGPSQMDRTVDDYPKHVWSINIEGRNHDRCVLNIDTNEETLPADLIQHVSGVISDLAKAIEKYSPAQLAFE